MVVQKNLNAKNAHNKLGANVIGAKKSSEKLSSGFRINRAGDDAAGLAVSEKMRALSKSGYSVNMQNINKGLGMVATADGAMQEIHAISHRMRELSVMVANGTYNDELDREAVDLEFQALKVEIERIITSTEYNGIKVFEGRENIINISVPGNTFSTVSFNDNHVIDNTNNTLTFRYNGTAYDGIPRPALIIPTGTYTNDELVNFLNSEFANLLGANRITVSIDENTGSLVYDAHGGVFDSFGGNMMRLSTSDSIISNIIRPGSTGSAASLTGARILPASPNMINITAADNPLSFDLTVASGGTIPVSINFAPGEHSRESIVNTINNYFTTNNITAQANIQSGQLVISRTIGGHGNGFITPIPSTGLNNMLFTGLDEDRTVNTRGGTTTTFPQINNPHFGTIIGTNTIPTRWHAVGSHASYTPSPSPEIGDIISGIPNVVSGGDPTVLAAELRTTPGIIASHTFNQSLAANFVINSSNNSFSFNYGGSSIFVEIDAGTYTPQTLASAISAKLPSGISCSINSTGQLSFLGDNFTNNFGGFSGSLLNAILVTEGVPPTDGNPGMPPTPNLSFTPVTARQEVEEWYYQLSSYTVNVLNTTEFTADTANPIITPHTAFVERRPFPWDYSFQNPIFIDSGNNEFTIRVTSPSANPATYDINLILDIGSHSIAEMNTMLSELITDWYDERSLTPEIQITGNTNLRIETTGQGAGWSISLPQTGAFDALYGKTRIVQPTPRPPSALNPAIAEGRINLSANTFTNIVAGVNDVLEFNLTINGNTTRHSAIIAPGSYNGDDLITAMNEAIQASGVEGVRADTMSAFSGIEGWYTTTRLIYEPRPGETAILDGIGGSAAYSVFYRGLLDEHIISPDKVKLQVGPRGITEEHIYVTNIPIEITLRRLGIKNSSISTRDEANEAIGKIDRAVRHVSLQRAKSGADYNALGTALSNVTSQNENLISAESRIRDTDMAKEMIKHTKYNILQQVAQAMLAQAKDVPQGVLQLLQ
jgi:flagellin